MIALVKFMLPNSTDELFVSVKSFKEGLFDPAKVKFIASSGKEYDAVYNNDKKGWTINLLGSNDNDGYSLYVVHQTGGDYATLAKLSVYSYLPKTVKLKLVPVNGFSNGFTAKTLSDELNKIYGKVGITCQVEITAPFNYEPLAGKALDVTGSGLFSVFTEDMSLLNTAYIAENTNETGAVLFIIEKATGTEKGTVYGDMPRGEQFGYLFGGASAQTIAHEIGHGLFKLEHPFKRAATANDFAEGDLRDNLMEYYGGTSLVKLQWDAIHHPGTVIGIFEQDEDAMSDVVNINDLIRWVKENNGKYINNFKKYKFFEYSTILEKYVEATIGGKKIPILAEMDKDGTIDLKFPKVEFTMNAKHHTSFSIAFIYSDSDNEAFKLWTYSYDNFISLLNAMGYTLNKDLKTNIINRYKGYLKEVGNDCNKLDVIYETIPDFVMETISVGDKMKHLKILTECSMVNTGWIFGTGFSTNEEVDILPLHVQRD